MSETKIDTGYNESINDAFEAELSKLPPAIQENIRDSMKRGESVTYNFFVAGFNAGIKYLEGAFK